MAEPYHRNSKAHRTLRRGDRGNDVAHLQVAAGNRIEQMRHVDVEPPPTGGQFNQRTIKAITALAYWLGMPIGHPITEGVQRVIRDPRRRSPAARIRARRRRRKANRPGYRIIRRSEWGAAPGRGTSPPLTTITRLFVHHTVYPTMPRSATKAQECARMRQIQQGAFAGGFSDVPYPFVVFPSGRVYEGRPLGRQGAATYNNNSTSTAIAWDGNMETSKPTAESIATGRKVRRAKAPGRAVEPHSSVYATACPGRNLRSRLGEIAR